MSNENQTKQTDLSAGDLAKIASQLDAARFESDDSVNTEGAQPESQTGQDAVDTPVVSEDAAQVAPEDNSQADKADTTVETPAEEAKPELSKIEKDEARLARNRREFEEEKRRWREEHAVQTEPEPFQIPDPNQQKQTQAALDKQANAVRDELGYTINDYERSAASFEQDGEYQHAREARARAEALRQKEGQIRQSELVKEWNKTVQEVLDENPAFRDRDSEEAKKVAQVLQSNPVFTFHPRGFEAAAKLVVAEKKAAVVPALEAEITKLKSEVTRLNGLLSVDGDSGAVVHHGGQDFKTLPADKRFAELQRQAAEADAQRF